MIAVNQFASGTSQAPARLPTPLQNVPDKVIVTRAINEQTLTLTSTDAAPYNLTNTDAVAIMAGQFGSINLGFGDKQLETVDDSIDFATYRVMHWVMTGRDFMFNGLELRNYTSGTNPVTVPATGGGTIAVTFELVRSFEFVRFGQRILDFCPGSIQARQLKFSFTRAAGGFSVDAGKVTQSGTADNVVSFDYEPGEKDSWVRVPRIYQNNNAGLVHEGPRGGVLAIWEATAVGGAGALANGIVSILRAGDAPLHDKVVAKRISQNAAYTLPLGAADPNTLVTMLWQPEPSMKPEQVPTSEKWALQQASNYLTMQSRWLYVPPSDQAFADEASRNLLSDDSGPVMLSPSAAANMDAPGHNVAISGLDIIKPGNPKFELQGGRVYRVNEPPVTFIPDRWRTAVHGAVGAELGDAAKDARLAHEANNVARYIPGGTSVNRGIVPPKGREILRAVAPSEGRATGAAAAQAASRA